MWQATEQAKAVAEAAAVEAVAAAARWWRTRSGAAALEADTAAVGAAEAAVRWMQRMQPAASAAAEAARARAMRGMSLLMAAAGGFDAASPVVANRARS